MKILDSTIITKEERTEKEKENALRTSNKLIQDLSKNIQQINYKLSLIEDKLSTKQMNTIDSQRRT